jgi:hypothetical protein
MSYYTKDQVLGVEPIKDLGDELFSKFTTKIKLIALSNRLINQKIIDIKKYITEIEEEIFEDTPRRYFYPDSMGPHSGVTLETRVRENKLAFRNIIRELLFCTALKTALSIGKPQKIVNDEALLALDKIQNSVDILKDLIQKGDDK